MYSSKLRLNKRFQLAIEQAKITSINSVTRRIFYTWFRAISDISRNEKIGWFHRRASAEVSGKTNIYLLCISRSWYIEWNCRQIFSVSVEWRASSCACAAMLNKSWRIEFPECTRVTTCDKSRIGAYLLLKLIRARLENKIGIHACEVRGVNYILTVYSIVIMCGNTPGEYLLELPNCTSRLSIMKRFVRWD